MNQRKLTHLAAAAAACLAAGGVVAAAGAEDGAAPAQSEAEGAVAAPVAEVPAEQGRRIGQLRRDRNGDDALPTIWRAKLREETDRRREWGANPSLSRRTAPGVWILPGDDYVCVANAVPGEDALGFGCATPAEVEQGLLAPSDVDANGNGLLTGVLPDGVGSVTLVDKDGSSRTVAVERNTYQAAIDADLKEVRFTDSGGGQHVLPMAWTG